MIVGGRCHLHCHADETSVIKRTGELGKRREEAVARLAVRSLIGYAPDDDVGTVLIASNHVAKLTFGILICVGILPGDGPVARNLAPHHDAHTFGFAHSMFVVRVVSQTHVVAAQFLSPVEQCASILG